MTEDQIWLVVGVVVAILVLRAMTVKKLNGPQAPFGGVKHNSRLRGGASPRVSSISDPGMVEAVRQMLEGGRFIEAVKYVKETKKIGLKEAKMLVESIQKNQMQKPSKKEKFSSTEIATRARHLKQGGHPIDAVKFVRDQTSMDLLAAKRFVDSL